MKTTTTALTFIILFLASFSFAQTTCTIPNGSFETWIDLTDDFDETGELPAGTIMLPENYFGIFRFFISSFLEIFETFTGDELIEASSMFFGMYQSTDASEGDFSLQMQADETFPFVDAFVVVPCVEEELPSSFCFDLKHVGTGTDTFSIIGAFDEESTLALDDYGTQDASAFFIIDSIILEGDTEWISYNIPVVDNMNGISPDTALIFMIMSSNEDSIAAGVESYYLVDNLNFKLEGVLPLATTSINGVHENDHNRISWSVLNEENLSHYLLERSYENLDNWSEIGKLEINPTGANIYSFDDYEINKRGIYYYRIRKFDLNGNESLSKLIEIDVPILGHLSLVTYPNPAKDQLNLDFFLSESSESISYNLFSVDGKEYKFNTDFPNSLDAGVNRIVIDVNDLPVGVYNLIVKSEFTEVNKRIVITN